MKTYIFWDIKPYYSLKVNRRLEERVCYLIQTGLLLELFFYLEDVDDIYAETSVDLRRTIRLYMQDDSTLQESDKTQQMTISDGNLNPRSQCLSGTRHSVWPSECSNIKVATAGEASVFA
jgi:hypothetical protein